MGASPAHAEHPGTNAAGVRAHSTTADTQPRQGWNGNSRRLLKQVRPRPPASLAEIMIIFWGFLCHGFKCGSLPGRSGDVLSGAWRYSLISSYEFAHRLFQLPVT